GANYENFYYPGSGLFQPGVVDDLVSNHNTPETEKRISALDWFTLYEYDVNGERKPGYVSKCAQRVAEIPSCADKVELVFGGMDAIIADRSLDTYGQYVYGNPINHNDAYGYGWAKLDDGMTTIPWNAPNYKFKNRRLRPTGVATEVYNQIIDNLITQCMNLDGKFIEAQFVDHGLYYLTNRACNVLWEDIAEPIRAGYRYTGDTPEVVIDENMCPKDYVTNVDSNAWGICSCWGNGGRRSKDGTFNKCVAALPVTRMDEHQNDNCLPNDNFEEHPTINDWCISTVNKNTNQVCPMGPQNPNCTIPDGVPAGITQ
ncbi:MAG: hypothetical protein II179_00275, partial [Alphaproteobacteria bacterium]|nr:hypothetical protein [Alphaproteobacteria bacterium]